MSTIHDQRYVKLVRSLRDSRRSIGIPQERLAELLNQPQSYVAKVENLERRLDVIELADWINALGIDLESFLLSVDFIGKKEYSTSIPALPIPNKVQSTKDGIILPLAWQGKEVFVTLTGLTTEQYLDVENRITEIYTALNKPDNNLKNRESICTAMEYAFSKLPNLNPSDVYHHIVYRLYLREYKKTQADRSWVRAGGEAIELFVERHYSPLLNPSGIFIKALISNSDKYNALKQMGIEDQVGSSKLDVAIYGLLGDKKEIFGGVHIKASLAERVSDDVPCSQAMMQKGYMSYLFTFDAKSFPPPNGDLVNRGELGTPSTPSDKRRYIEEQGLFDACFCYNLRSVPSSDETASGKKIYVGSFKPEQDPMPVNIIEAWTSFREKL